MTFNIGHQIRKVCRNENFINFLNWNWVSKANNRTKSNPHPIFSLNIFQEKTSLKKSLSIQISLCLSLSIFLSLFVLHPISLSLSSFSFVQFSFDPFSKMCQFQKSKFDTESRRTELIKKKIQILKFFSFEWYLRLIFWKNIWTKLKIVEQKLFWNCIFTLLWGPWISTVVNCQSGKKVHSRRKVKWKW